MVVNVKSRVGFHRRLLLFVSLMMLFGLLISLFSCTTAMDAENTSLKKTVHVKSETDLYNAVYNLPYGAAVVIVLNNDITLTKGSLAISDNKDVTLTSKKATNFYKLIGATKRAEDHSLATYEDTITVYRGVLRLDGIIITHEKDIFGTGICVYEDGTLIMYDGKISGNHIPYAYVGHGSFVGNGGGVYNWGVFEMFNGIISDNTAGNGGGGVYHLGTFTMYNGTISNNSASWYGGGVYGGGVFEMFNGIISGNTAGIQGGGVDNRRNFTMHNGTITNNHANQMGGGIYNSGTFHKLNGTISDNTAPEGNNIYPQENNTIEDVEDNNKLFNTISYVGIFVIVKVSVISVLFLYLKKKKNSQ